MGKSELLELMHDYISQYGIMGSFLDYCQDDCNLEKEDVKEAIDELIYGG